MAREAYRSLYGDLTKLKDDSALKDPANGAGDDDELFQLLLAVSDWVDHYCNRHFYPRVQTLEFDGHGSPHLPVPDLIGVAALREDTKGEGVFDTVWPSSDYRVVAHGIPSLPAIGVRPSTWSGPRPRPAAPACFRKGRVTSGSTALGATGGSPKPAAPA